MIKRNNTIICFVLLFLLIIVLLCNHKFYLLRRRSPLTEDQVKELSLLGSKAVASLDVPVASILLYHDSIIGRGYNTVNVDTNLTAHAEINAINAALKSYGFKKFNELDRTQLKLIATFEPCAMCRALIIKCGINQTEFVKEKSLSHWIKEDLKIYLYQWRKTQLTPKNLQDSLFRLHPYYDAAKQQ